MPSGIAYAPANLIIHKHVMTVLWPVPLCSSLQHGANARALCFSMDRNYFRYKQL